MKEWETKSLEKKRNYSSKKRLRDGEYERKE